MNTAMRLDELKQMDVFHNIKLFHNVCSIIQVSFISLPTSQTHLQECQGYG